MLQHAEGVSFGVTLACRIAPPPHPRCPSFTARRALSSSFPLQQGLSLTDLLNCKLYTDEEVYLADLSELPALQRCVAHLPFCIARELSLAEGTKPRM